MFIFEITELIADSYGLNDAVMIQLVFVYTMYVGDKGNTQPKYIEQDHKRIIGKRACRIDTNPDVPPIDLTILDITMKVRVNVGDVIETEDMCDLEYMVGAMDQVGQSAQKQYYWVPLYKFIFMVMDNAGGHGTKETVQLYTEMLKTKYNIIIIHQVPRFPYTNLLDLGVWCSLQAAVEKEHYMKRTDVHALQNSVMSAWDTRPLDQVIGKVWTRMTKVLALIVEGYGGNDLVEKKKRKTMERTRFTTRISRSSQWNNCSCNHYYTCRNLWLRCGWRGWWQPRWNDNTINLMKIVFIHLCLSPCVYYFTHIKYIPQLYSHTNLSVGNIFNCLCFFISFCLLQPHIGNICYHRCRQQPLKSTFLLCTTFYAWKKRRKVIQLKRYID